MMINKNRKRIVFKKIIYILTVICLVTTLTISSKHVTSFAADNNQHTHIHTEHLDHVSTGTLINPVLRESLDIDLAAGTNYSLFNSGNTTASGYDRYKSPNPNPNSYNNNGYDLYGTVSRSSNKYRFILGMSFLVNIDVTEQALLSIKAYDVDETVKACGHGYEYDYIYLVDETTNKAVKLDGHLSGQNNTWNTTQFSISPDLFVNGHTYHFELEMTCTGSSSCSYYSVTVRNVDLIMNGVSDPNVKPQEGIENAELQASISSNGLVNVKLTANSYLDANYTLEYKAVNLADGGQYGGTQYSVTIPTLQEEFVTSFSLESGAARGTYEITVFIIDANGSAVATRSATASYGYSAVSYNSNGGSQNLPTDKTSYSSGDIVNVKFDYVPSLYGYKFLGWSTNRNDTIPMYAKDGVTQFAIGSNDVTLYAIWGKECNHNWETKYKYQTFEEAVAAFKAAMEEAYGGSFNRWSGNANIFKLFTEFDEWDWVLDYWAFVNDNNYNGYKNGDIFRSLKNGDTTIDPYFISVEADAFVKLTEVAVYSGELKSANYASKEVQNAIWNFIPAPDPYRFETFDQFVTEFIKDYGTWAAEFCAANGTSFVYLDVDGDPCSKNYGKITKDNWSASMENVVGHANWKSTLFFEDARYAEKWGWFYSFWEEQITTTMKHDGLDWGYADITHKYAWRQAIQAYLTGTYWPSWPYSPDFTGRTETPYWVGKNTEGPTWTETSRIEYCDKFGSVTKTCSCGETFVVIIEPLGHDYVIVNTVEATCTEDGYIEFKCQRNGCGETKRQVIEKLNHHYGSDNVCDYCGYVVISHEHNYEVKVVDPTCTSMGYTEYTCSCGDSYRNEYLEPTRHAWNDGEVITKATCTDDGVKRYTCNDCSATKDHILLAGHDWSENIVTEATCTEDGSATRKCNGCGISETIVIPASHTWNEGTVTLKPDCDSKGLKTCTCDVCGESKEFEVPEKGHEYINGVCTHCNEKFINHIGGTTHPIYGMYFEIDDILSDYGPSLIDEYGLLLDHNKDANLEKVAVYLEQDGTMWRRCIAVRGTNIQYATYVPYLSYQSEIKYSGLNHDWINIFRLRETQNNIWCYNNYATIGVNLQDAYGNLLLTLYHIAQAGAETRIFDNLDEMKAWLNGKCYKHVESDWIITTAPTCLPGYQYKECTECHAILAEEILSPAYNHISSDWIVDVESTATEEGIRHKECIECHEVLETETTPVLATLVIENVEAENGKTVQVAINIENNPGIIGAVLTINFDSALKLVDAKRGEAWNSLYFTKPSALVNACNFVWDGLNGADYTNGSVLILTFEIPEDAKEGTVYNITASYTAGNVINANLEPVKLEIESGSITVINLLGDVNQDGIIDVADVITLRRHLAGGYDVVIDEEASDMNQDGSITVADVVLLRRFLVS